MRLRRWARRLGMAALSWRLLGPVLVPRFGFGQEHPWRVPGRTVFVGDRELFVREVGPPGGSPVVLVHGLGGSSLAEWYRIGPRLAAGHRVVMIDYRSHGLAAKELGRYEVADLADDLAGVLTALGLGAVTLVGYSMGGTVVQSFAHRHPDRVERLVLIATFVRHPGAVRWVTRVAFWLVRAWERLTGWGTAEVRAAYLLAVGAVERRHARWLWGETHRRDTEAGSAASFAMLRFDSGGWVSGIRRPALVVITGDDQLVPPSWQHELASSLPDAEVVELADARHEAPWTHADAIADAIIEFMEEAR